jgi:hypothetical protein
MQHQCLLWGKEQRLGIQTSHGSNPALATSLLYNPDHSL